MPPRRSCWSWCSRGSAAVGLALPISVAIAGLLGILVLSYRQIIKAYSSSGGAYVVSRDNFGGLVASIAGSALIIDYILTVAVSVSAARPPSPRPSTPWSRGGWIAVGFVVVLAWGNLRGLRESGRIFAIPTYLYVAGMAVVVLWGIWQWAFGGLGRSQYAPEAGRQQQEGAALVPVSLFLILHAFSAGVTALTGVEAISNGVSAFRNPGPQRPHHPGRHGRHHGLPLHRHHLPGHPFRRPTIRARNPTLVAQLARHVLGNPAAFIAIQVATLLILVLAANTSFSSFPLLASFAADDAILPRQLRKRGHRLVYSNGILVLSAAAVFLIVFEADTHHLIPLYAIGVVTSFTLAQSGMARRHLRLRQPGWRKGLLINGTGALITLVVLVVIAITKFADGAWMVCIAIPALVLLLQRVQRTYRSRGDPAQGGGLPAPGPTQATARGRRPLGGSRPGGHRRPAVRPPAQPLSITALHVAVDPDRPRAGPPLGQVRIPIPLELVDAPDRNLPATVEETVAEMVRPDTEVTVLVPRRRYVGFWRRVLHDQTSAELTKVLGELENVNVTLVPYRLRHRGGLRPVPSSSTEAAASWASNRRSSP